MLKNYTKKDQKLPLFGVGPYMTITLINTEEKWLLDIYGDEYEAYKKRVNRCIPWKKGDRKK